MMAGKAISSGGIPPESTQFSMASATPADGLDRQRPSHGRDADDNAWREPTRIVDQFMHENAHVQFCDSTQVRFWGFSCTTDSVCSWQPAIVRVREEDLVQLRLEMPQSWHDRCAQFAEQRQRRTPKWNARDRQGLIYQWRAGLGGTWLFQPHDATPHDFEMGLYGLLIVDPTPAEDGMHRLYRGGPSYDIERCLVLDDVDPSWHEPSVDASTLRRSPFRPSHFTVNGVPSTLAGESSNCAIRACPGQRVLLRVLNASFSLLKVCLPGLCADIVAIDGEPLGAPDRPWLKSKPVAAGEPVYLATGSRFDMIVDLAEQPNAHSIKGSYPIRFEFLDPRTRKLRNADASSPSNLGLATTLINVNA